MILPMTANIENLRERDAIKIKSVGNAQNRTRETHRRATLIRPTKATIDVRYAIKIRATGKRTLSNYAKS